LNIPVFQPFLQKKQEMKIVLVGYMGSGKSVIGNTLAGELGIPFIDLDSYIESELHSSIPDIFREKGELFFRKKEHELLQQLLQKHTSFVLSSGGGTPCYSGNMALINNHTPNTFYLKMTIPGLVARLQKEKAHRPLIAHLSDEELPEFIGKHLFERNPFYQQAAHAIPCDAKTVVEVVMEIRALLG
jgi:shikimate kinase